MGKIVVSENVTLDGVTQDPTGEEGTGSGGWFGRLTEGDYAAFAELELREALGTAALLLGGRSYEWFAARWTSRTGEWADRLRALPKYVVSTTVTELPWGDSSLLTGDVVDDVTKLRDRVDGDVVVYASGRLVRTLLAQDLVDELRLLVYPFVVGQGERLFGADGVPQRLRPAAARTVGEGLVHLTYQVVREA